MHNSTTFSEIPMYLQNDRNQNTAFATFRNTNTNKIDLL